MATDETSSPSVPDPTTPGRNLHGFLRPGDSGTVAADPTPAPDENAAPARRKRGELEYAVKEFCDAYVTGNLKEELGESPLTPSRLARMIQTKYPEARNASVGAVTAVLNKWEVIGFAEIGRGPTCFVRYTQAGYDIGLSGLKEKAREARKAARAAEKAAAKAAAGEGAQTGEATGEAIETAGGTETDEGVEGGEAASAPAA